MCLILLAWQAHPDYPLVVAANRDEFFARPTAPAAFWPEAPQVLAGRDLEAGGTWLGVTRQGRFAALTNYRDSATIKPNARSRGLLVSRFLTGKQSPERYLTELQADAESYNGYNLIFGDRAELYCYSNRDTAAQRLAPGIYGLSNHLLDTPWPKVARGKSALALALDALPRRLHAFHGNSRRTERGSQGHTNPLWTSIYSQIADRPSVLLRKRNFFVECVPTYRNIRTHLLGASS